MGLSVLRSEEASRQFESAGIEVAANEVEVEVAETAARAAAAAIATAPASSATTTTTTAEAATDEEDANGDSGDEEEEEWLEWAAKSNSRARSPEYDDVTDENQDVRGTVAVGELSVHVSL
jgi:hypothetical protein